MNRDYKKTSTRPSNPYEDANFVSKYFYWWLKDLLKMGMSKQISEDDLYECSRQHKSEKVTKKFEMLWSKEMTKEFPSLMRITLAEYWYRVIIVGFFFGTFEMVCKYVIDSKG